MINTFSIFCLIVTALVIAVFLFLLIPFYISTDFSFCKSTLKGKLLFRFLNPLFFQMDYDFESKKLVCKVFGVIIHKKEKKLQEKASSEKQQLTDRDLSMEPSDIQETEKKGSSGKENVETDSSQNADGNAPDSIGVELQAQSGCTEPKNGYDPQASLSQINSGESIDEKKCTEKSKVKNGTKLGCKITGKFRDILEIFTNSKYVFFLREKRAIGKIWDWLCRVTIKILNIVSFRRVSLKVKGGVEDPVVLGKIYGYIEAFRYGLNLNKKMELEFTPVFMQNYLECSGRVLFVGNLWRFILPFIVAVVTFPYLSMFFVWLRYKKFTKNRAKGNLQENGLGTNGAKGSQQEK